MGNNCDSKCHNGRGSGKLRTFRSLSKHPVVIRYAGSQSAGRHGNCLAKQVDWNIWHSFTTCTSSMRSAESKVTLELNIMCGQV